MDPEPTMRMRCGADPAEEAMTRHAMRRWLDEVHRRSDDSTRCAAEEPSQPMRTRCSSRRGVAARPDPIATTTAVGCGEWEWSAGAGEVAR
jgi:hypothetical protein